MLISLSYNDSLVSLSIIEIAAVYGLNGQYFILSFIIILTGALWLLCFCEMKEKKMSCSCFFSSSFLEDFYYPGAAGNN